MATETEAAGKPKRTNKRAEAPPGFMRKAELLRELQIDRKTLDRMIVAGIIPPPHSRLGPKVALWRREHYRYFEVHKRWPTEAFPSRQG